MRYGASSSPAPRKRVIGTIPYAGENNGQQRHMAGEPSEPATQVVTPATHSQHGDRTVVRGAPCALIALISATQPLSPLSRLAHSPERIPSPARATTQQSRACQRAHQGESWTRAGRAEAMGACGRSVYFIRYDGVAVGCGRSAARFCSAKRCPRSVPNFLMRPKLVHQW